MDLIVFFFIVVPGMIVVCTVPVVSVLEYVSGGTSRKQKFLEKLIVLMIGIMLTSYAVLELLQ
ncbi:MAG: hypothetical protein D6698_15465 [Gammaproteobacteria bacterium]|nr:MAG: hypothetical protein D6698_15465 [Gammaproteobacteria bacterium]